MSPKNNKKKSKYESTVITKYSKRNRKHTSFFAYSNKFELTTVLNQSNQNSDTDSDYFSVLTPPIAGPSRSTTSKKKTSNPRDTLQHKTATLRQLIENANRGNVLAPSTEDVISKQSSCSSLDIIGRLPSHSSVEADATPFRDDINQRTSRKQPKPKQRKDRALQELIKLQSTTKLLIPRLPFQRLVREVLQQFQQDFRMQTATLECLQEASESYLVGLLEDSYLCCMHRQRLTLNEKDMRLVQIIRGQTDLRKK